MPLTGRRMAICAPRDNILLNLCDVAKVQSLCHLNSLMLVIAFSIFMHFSRDFSAKWFFVQVRYIHYSAEATLGWSRPLLEFSASVWFNSFGTELPIRPALKCNKKFGCHVSTLDSHGWQMLFALPVSMQGFPQVWFQDTNLRNMTCCLFRLGRNLSTRARCGSEGLYQSVSSVQSRPIYNLS